MDVFFDERFYEVYSGDPAAEAGRMESIVRAIRQKVRFKEIKPASEAMISLAHKSEQIERVKKQGTFEMAQLAAGGAIQAAEAGLQHPAFGLIRPPGHHASSGNAWGFCYFNNMAIAIEVLKSRGLINTALILDIDMHYGDGTVNILKDRAYITIHNLETEDRTEYLREVELLFERCHVDIIGISAGFDNHVKDWGGVLETEDYTTIGQLALKASRKVGSGLFAILEGGYNHEVLGDNVMALIDGMSTD